MNGLRKRLVTLGTAAALAGAPTACGNFQDWSWGTTTGAGDDGGDGGTIPDQYKSYYMHADTNYLPGPNTCDCNCDINNLNDDVTPFRDWLKTKGWKGICAHDIHPQGACDIPATPNAFFEGSELIPFLDQPSPGEKGSDHMLADAATLLVVSMHGTTSSDDRFLVGSENVIPYPEDANFVPGTDGKTPCDVRLKDLKLGGLHGSKARVVIYDASCVGHSTDLLAAGLDAPDFTIQNIENRVWQYLAFQDSPYLGTTELTASGEATAVSSNRYGWLEMMTANVPENLNQPIIYTSLDETEPGGYPVLDARHENANYLYGDYIPAAPPATQNAMRATSSMTQDDPFGMENDDPAFNNCN